VLSFHRSSPIGDVSERPRGGARNSLSVVWPGP
jgi:hypothetical protein